MISVNVVECVYQCRIQCKLAIGIWNACCGNFTTSNRGIQYASEVTTDSAGGIMNEIIIWKYLAGNTIRTGGIDLATIFGNEYICWNIQCARLNSQFTSSIWKCKYYCHLDYNSILRYYHILTSNLDPIQTNCLGKHKCKTCCLPCAERVEFIKFGLYRMSRLKCSGFLATCGCS